MDRQPCVYIMASDRNGTIYIGVTSDLLGRLYQHRASEISGLTSCYGVTKLVRFELFGDMTGAITREKQLKNWRRAWKLNLIEQDNPHWEDLAVELGFDPNDSR
ncbi:GIY-YIG nuclease family protein [Sphingomonas sp. SRS2]|uniref:GIY-YIG nuclease family protein n=1 Tax=Sphingomonas sp. SRS2 TaxID=133190 RepID=UPI0006184B58|nr:GIY-YIG nuclease family protein [Sphingomonas sp. SRS2]KKC26596.1 endonuclease [Sphingomonas sp. SRS2]